MKYEFILWRAKMKEKRLLKMQRKYRKWLKEVYLPAVSDEISKTKANMEIASARYNEFDAYLK